MRIGESVSACLTSGTAAWILMKFDARAAYKKLQAPAVLIDVIQVQLHRE
jgi:hypothetical protein